MPTLECYTCQNKQTLCYKLKDKHDTLKMKLVHKNEYINTMKITNSIVKQLTCTQLKFKILDSATRYLYD